jgi:hypothetical protein
MKRNVVLLSVCLALFLFMVVELQVLDYARANPIRYSWVPTTQDTSCPDLIIESPIPNNMYNSSAEVVLNFTVFLPESWFSNDPIGDAPYGYYCNGKILYTEIMVDGEQIQNLSLSKDRYLPYSSSVPLEKNLTLSLPLSVEDGEHTLIVHAVGESYYMPPENWLPQTHGGILLTERSTVSVESDPITFHVGPKPSAYLNDWDILPAILFLVTFLAVASCSIIYFKRKNHETNPRSP